MTIKVALEFENLAEMLEFFSNLNQPAPIVETKEAIVEPEPEVKPEKPKEESRPKGNMIPGQTATLIQGRAGTFYTACFEAGMTAQEAANIRGVTVQAAHAWARNAGLTWPSPKKPKKAKKPKKVKKPKKAKKPKKVKEPKKVEKAKKPKKTESVADANDRRIRDLIRSGSPKEVEGKVRLEEAPVVEPKKETKSVNWMFEHIYAAICNSIEQGSVSSKKIADELDILNEERIIAIEVCSKLMKAFSTYSKTDYQVLNNTVEGEKVFILLSLNYNATVPKLSLLRHL